MKTMMINIDLIVEVISEVITEVVITEVSIRINSQMMQNVKKKEKVILMIMDNYIEYLSQNIARLQRSRQSMSMLSRLKFLPEIFLFSE
ncbi:MAG: hypothetical protein EZS28_033471 [Streblomastix strix]|uniref:Uncharacterized protein n=1 Tax=Streblomastix strix TaxID=222440 RepID=A0A5J4ULR9_9EUKA|nr:MAG: hypothetical protein EZS28_033471 [Streblomastix strix]